MLGLGFTVGMARKLRVQYEGAIYHVMSRGNQRRPIVREDADRVLSLKTLGEACGKTGWQIHAPKGDPGMVRLARRLRRETTMTHAWIADRLKMGTRGHLTHLLYWQGAQARMKQAIEYNTKNRPLLPFMSYVMNCNELQTKSSKGPFPKDL